MFSEILKLIPKIDGGDLSKMERLLNGRFGKIAKKFGKGLVASLAGGGIAGIALGFIDKLLNPLKETQEAIDKVLKHGDDVVTNAKQFNTTAGKLFKLQALGKATGLDPESLSMLINKFQTAVAEATADKTKQTSVRKFVGEKDTVEAFFNFIQSLQKMDKNQQLLVQQEVFGEKQVLKMADFLQSDFSKLTKLLGNKPAEKFTPGLEKLADLNDLKDALEARREMDDTLTKSRLITSGMVTSQDRAERLNLEKENARIASYQSLATINETSNKILGIVEQGFLKLADILTKLTGLTDAIKKFSVSRTIRGIFGGGDDK